MSRQPFISVVVATYNRENTLRNCLDSIFKQTYPKDRYEAVIVNDGSTDKTEETLRGYEHKAPCGFKWYTQENKGLTEARNRGIENSGGEIICFTDDDCIVDKDWIKNLVKGFRDEKVGGVGGKIVEYDSKTITQRYIEESRLLSQEKFRSMNFLLAGNSAYRRDVLKTIGGFDDFLISCEDVDLSIQTQLRGYSIGYIPEATAYHSHPSTVKDLFRQQYRDHVGFAQLHKKYTKHFNPGYNLVLLSYRIARRMIAYPLVVLTSITTKDRKYRLCEPILHIIVMSATMLGIMKETLRGDEYPGKKIQEKLDFIEDQSISALLKKIRSKVM